MILVTLTRNTSVSQSYMFLVRLDPILVIYLNSMQRIGKTIVELNPTPMAIGSVYWANDNNGVKHAPAFRCIMKWWKDSSTELQ